MTTKSSFDFLEAARRESRYKSLSQAGTVTRKKAVAIGLGIIFLAAAGGSPWLREYEVQMEISQVNAKIAALSTLTGKVNRLNDLEKESRRQTALLGLKRAQAGHPVEVLAKVVALLPAGTTIKQFSFQSDKSVSLGLNVPLPIDVARLWLSIDRSGTFQSVNIKSVSLQDKAQEIQLTLRLK
ncbi:hypothetical protein CEB3_c45760 [Peptococcaceae bacterium CEB3]|nr:hypothetical protein CEB3_c45760 [Peptococcaceae bacterium CEB3]